PFAVVRGVSPTANNPTPRLSQNDTVEPSPPNGSLRRPISSAWTTAATTYATPRPMTSGRSPNQPATPARMPPTNTTRYPWCPKWTNANVPPGRPTSAPITDTTPN